MKYLFTAFYEDGTCLQQTDEDISTRDLKRSAFFDVDHDNLVGFAIDSGDTICHVDLITGEFSINGVPFHAYDQEIKDRRLVYFRRNIRNFDQTLGEEVGHSITFHVGWQGNDPATGENIQRVLAFA